MSMRRVLIRSPPAESEVSEVSRAARKTTEESLTPSRGVRAVRKRGLQIASPESRVARLKGAKRTDLLLEESAILSDDADPDARAEARADDDARQSASEAGRAEHHLRRELRHLCRN